MNYFEGDALAVSRYFKRFERLRDADIMSLRGDNILVERLPPVQVKSKHGIILGQEVSTHANTMADALTEFGLVLAVGPGRLLPDGSTLEVAAQPGDIVLLPHTTYWYSQFCNMIGYDPYSIGRTRDQDVGMWFVDYKQAMEILNDQE